MKVNFKGELISWRGPAPFYFIPIPEPESQRIKKIANQITYGWGVLPVIARIKSMEFSTALIPRQGVYYLPIKNEVRFKLGIELGQNASVSLSFDA